MKRPLRPTSTRRLVALLSILVLGLASSLALAHGGGRDDDRRGKSSRFYNKKLRLTVPPEPVIAGDVLAFSRGKKIRDRELRRWVVLIGWKQAEFVRFDARTVGAIVPPGVSGSQPVVVVSRKGWWPRIELWKNVELGGIQLRTDGPAEDGTEFGFNFADPDRVEVGSVVEGWVRTPSLVTQGTKEAPVSVTGSVIARTGATLTLQLTGDDRPRTSRDGSEPGSIQNLSPVTLVTTVNLVTGGFDSTLTVPGSVVTGTDVGVIVDNLPEIDIALVPEIESVFPLAPPGGGIVTIEGRGFRDKKNLSRVTLSGQPVVVFPKVLEWSDTRIEVELPGFAQGPFELRVIVDTEPSEPFVLEIDPPCPPVPEFTRRLGDGRDEVANAIAQMPDCGFVLAGGASNDGGDALLIRTDRFGDEIWTRVFGGSGFDEAHDVLVSGRSIYFAGETSSPELGTEDPDFYVARVDFDGNLQWERVIENDKIDVARAIVARTDHNHGIEQAFVVGGYTSGGPFGRFDGLLYTIDPDGEVLAKQFVGGRGDDRIDDLLQLPSTGLLAIGRSSSPDIGAGAGFAAFAARLGFGLELQWQRAFGSSDDDSLLLSAGLDEAGRIRMTGQTDSILASVEADTMEGGQLLMLEIDDAANELDRRTFGASRLDVGTAGPFLQPDLGIAVAGFTENDYGGGDGADGLLLKTDCRGEPEQVRVVDFSSEGNVEQVLDALATPDRGFALAGSVGASRGSGRDDRDVLLATRAPFAPTQLPEIELFTANGFEGLQLRNGEPVTFRWRVNNASRVRVDRITTIGADLEVDEPLPGFADQTTTVQNFSLGAAACSGETCGDVVYRLTATSDCGTDVQNLTVSVIPVEGNVLLDDARLFEIESTLVQRFDQPEIYAPGTISGAILTGVSCYLGVCTNQYQYLPGSHIDFVSSFPASENRCIAGSGYPLANATPVVVGNVVTGGSPLADIDDVEPPLISFRADGTLASWSYGELFFVRGDTTPPTGLPIPDSAWFGHYSGWHTADGGMTIWGIDELSPEIIGVPFQPPALCFAPPEFGSGLRPIGCGALPAPVYPHPNAWDVHMFRDVEGGGLLRYGGLSYDVDVTDPCIDVPNPASECESGTAPLTVPGTGQIISVFPAVDFSTGTFIPTACRTGP